MGHLEDITWEIPQKEVIMEQLHMTKNLLNLNNIQHTNLGPTEVPFSYFQFNCLEHVFQWHNA